MSRCMITGVTRRLWVSSARASVGLRDYSSTSGRCRLRIAVCEDRLARTNAVSRAYVSFHLAYTHIFLCSSSGYGGTLTADMASCVANCESTFGMNCGLAGEHIASPFSFSQPVPNANLPTPSHRPNQCLVRRHEQKGLAQSLNDARWQLAEPCCSQRTD